MNTALTPREIVAELDKFIIGQKEAKRMVAIALRNRWRRRQLDPALRDEVAPKNIIMMGPTGVGKTEIARRLAKLAASPFIKVEATKYTEVGYVGRDVESIVRDLMEIGIALVREEESERVRQKAEERAEERLLDLLLPSSPASAQPSSSSPSRVDYVAYSDDKPAVPAESSGKSTREKLRDLYRQGNLNDREVEMEVEESGPQLEVLSMPGLEQVGSQFKDMFGKMFPSRKKRRRMKIAEAYGMLVQQETQRLLDQDKVAEMARERVEQSGIVFIDEIDKVAVPTKSRQGADVSREGVQRDLLPIVEGSSVSTKYGIVKTDHILFIAAGAFHFAKPADLIPELQGRFPLRVELSALGKDEFFRILTEPHNALTRQYEALLGTEALEEISAFAEQVNLQTENIGARRLYTIMEKILADLSFDAPEKTGETVVIDRDYVRERVKDVRVNTDLSRFIL